MWPPILLAAVSLFSQIGGIHAQTSCDVLVTLASFQISSDNQWAVKTYWSNSVDCKVQVVDTNQVTVYGSNTCKAQQFCTIPVNIRPQCVGGVMSDDRFILRTDCSACFKANSREFSWNDPLKSKTCDDTSREYVECENKNTCPTGVTYTGPGCYCKDDKYLYEPTNECVDRSDPRCGPSAAIIPSVNLFVPPCIEVARPLAITWNPLIPINKYEVRDYTGDLVVGDTVSGGAGTVSIDAPYVGIYEVTVFGVADGESFNESAIFYTKEENRIVEKAFSVHALPTANGVTVCFSSAQKDVSYMCQEGSGTKTPCTNCASYSRADGTEKVTIYLLGSGVEVEQQSFYYRV